MAGYSYPEAARLLLTGEPTRMQNVATNWTGFASACKLAAQNISGVSGNVTAQHGQAYQNFGSRAEGVAQWLNAVAGIAEEVAEGLTRAGGTGSTAQFRRDEIVRDHENHTAGIRAMDAVANAFTAEPLPPGGSPTAQAQVREAENAAAQQLNVEIDKWSAAFDGFTVAAVPPAPGPSGTSDPGGPSGPAPIQVGAGPATPSGTAAGIPTGGDQAAPVVAGHGIGGNHPISPVVSAEGGDFAGWVRDPTTGYLVDPATGREFDPTTGRWIDPVTGQPFGELTQYAARLEGLHGGVPAQGLLATGSGVGLASGGPAYGGYNFAALYSGAIPPSLAASNPAALQLGQQAARHMDVKSFAAQQLAAREAAQGARPFVPPMAHGGSAGVATSGRAAGPRYPGAPASIWTRRPAGGVNPGAAGGLAGSSGNPAGGGRPPVPPVTAPSAPAVQDGSHAQQPSRAMRLRDDVWAHRRRAVYGVLGDPPQDDQRR